jgi:phosphatidylethanolamine/phosphatidyl-N-methylethanolamine N-methyltransferase
MPNEFIDFLLGWSRHPMAVGGPFASSPWTARRLAQAALETAIPHAGPVLELGAGTGRVTDALIAAGWPVDRIVAVERDGVLCRSLRQRFPGLRVLHANALDLDAVLARAGLASVSVVISGLPMRAVAPQAAARCYGEAFRRLPGGGVIIQYTYGFKAPVNPARTTPPFDAVFVGREWRNVPPIGIWKYRHLEHHSEATLVDAGSSGLD